ncbi:bifunctional [glutamate--ammonia ligase]-adenylyl-L-tyrosine phosphorylase/[glutamate--ammonia-ligase] adenylyltransferase [Psychrosphaera aestuarii]|uniref:bifunctional [glutamate--ammonia ligase]-adenylyl-L-tyrosine phosphorylase/[glutamate--ammonia-ligase] adenylyltransferase n=1 Tax=Psychrosphaera aestuarii TaxID=1266052 RepID=UPI001B3348C1|nr:bifunctional [glutamate--ammonia ligase]-adenylyl-L-tyrosine phosphorylase/[glutamate--ammonia-ligase] adenylyltransferase [Psychrosphaera aestuarii]
MNDEAEFEQASNKQNGNSATISLEHLDASLRQLGERRLDELCALNICRVDEDNAPTLIYLLAISDFIYRNCTRYPEVLKDLANNHLNLQTPTWSMTEKEWQAKNEQEALKALRIHRQHIMTSIAAQHFLGQIDIKNSMRQLSYAADLFYGLARQWAEADLAPRWGLPILNNGNRVALIAMGMGKLGGYELNFSSDIDLIFCYREKGVTSGGRKQEDFQAYFTKLSQKIIHLLDTLTPDGQVFRVDMRLRPFGDSGPLVSSFAALEDYYQEQGREWERYALLKARPLAHYDFTSDEEASAQRQLINLLKPFVYRRYIDFSVIESLRTMKRQIETEVVRRNLVNNIKLGKGGIREAEFIVQALQMLRGGKEPQLQLPSFLSVLPELARIKIFTEDEANAIQTSYLWLRNCEQYLQAFDDKQTQTLPKDKTNQNRLLATLGLSDWAHLLTKVNNVTQVIHHIFGELIGETPSDQNAKSDPRSEYWQSAWSSDPQEVEIPITESEHQVSTEADSRKSLALCLNELKPDLIKAVLSSKGRDRLDLLVPHLMSECERQQTSTQQCRDILQIIKRIAARTTYLALLVEHPGALTQLVSLVSASHFIGQELKNFPLLLDQLIDPKLLYTVPKLSDYEADLRRSLLRVDEDDLELQMEILRQFKLSSQLIIAACDISQIIDLPSVSNHLTALSEAILNQVVNLSWRQMVKKYGYPDGATDMDKNFAVVGYGKLGGHELGYGSDLDVVFIHGCESSKATNGKKAIDSRQFYLKLAQRILHFFTTRTPSGILYELDTRLRPSGASGLLAININTFDDYQHNEAWTWEHQALVRARAVLGCEHLIIQFEDVRKSILKATRNKTELINDISAMRQRMFENLSKESETMFDLKQSRGGIADIEFITQYLVLQFSQKFEKLADYCDNKRLLELAAQLNLISKDDSQKLWLAYEDYRILFHQQSLNLEEKRIPHAVVQTHAHNVKCIWHRLGMS